MGRENHRSIVGTFLVFCVAVPIGLAQQTSVLEQGFEEQMPGQIPLAWTVTWG